MNDSGDSSFEVFSDNLRLFNSIYDDISDAKKYIYIETYKFGKDSIGIKFRDILTKKQQQGIEVKLLIDGWGSSVTESFFPDLIKAGGDVKFFQKLEFGLRFFNKNHKRDHRKILIIDDVISYIGSANFTDYSINWRELNLRLSGGIAFPLKKIFLENFDIANKPFVKNIPFEKYKKLLSKYREIIRYKDFEIICDIPSTVIQPTKKKYNDLIKDAKKQIIIETPYFLPSRSLRRSLINAAENGVDVTVIIPKHSDVTAIDLLRNKYVGDLFKNNIKIMLYVPRNLHAKLMMVDNRIFSISSANFDYRSFRFQYEIALIGNNPLIIEKLDEHIAETISESEEFDYNKWLARPLIEKFFERLLIPFRHLF